jgi:hypothetical protein
MDPPKLSDEKAALSDFLKNHASELEHLYEDRPEDIKKAKTVVQDLQKRVNKLNDSSRENEVENLVDSIRQAKAFVRKTIFSEKPIPFVLQEKAKRFATAKNFQGIALKKLVEATVDVLTQIANNRIAFLEEIDATLDRINQNKFILNRRVELARTSYEVEEILEELPVIDESIFSEKVKTIIEEMNAAKASTIRMHAREEVPQTDEDEEGPDYNDHEVSEVSELPPMQSFSGTSEPDDVERPSNLPEESARQHIDEKSKQPVEMLLQMDFQNFNPWFKEVYTTYLNSTEMLGNFNTSLGNLRLNSTTGNNSGMNELIKELEQEQSKIRNAIHTLDEILEQNNLENKAINDVRNAFRNLEKTDPAKFRGIVVNYKDDITKKAAFLKGILEVLINTSKNNLSNRINKIHNEAAFAGGVKLKRSSKKQITKKQSSKKRRQCRPKPTRSKRNKKKSTKY